MRTSRVELTKVSRPLKRLFAVYLEWYLRRNLHAIRIAKSPALDIPAEMPLIVCLNHPSWWDPLLALTLATHVFPERTHYGPIEAASLAKYKFFERLGFFGIEPGTARGAARFLQLGQAILSRPGTALWVTAQGAFVDARARPVQLRQGIGHLVRRLNGVAVLPLAIEYSHWEERFPEALVRFGEPVLVERGAEYSAKDWTDRIAKTLEETQDALARQSIARDRMAFDVMLGGRAGVGGIYDLWRGVRAALSGHRFRREHRPEHP